MRIPRRTDLPYDQIPGTIIVELQEPPAHIKGQGFTLKQLQAMLGGDEGDIEDPYRGVKHRVSLKKWLRDKPNVQLVVYCNFIYDKQYVRNHPEVFPKPPKDRSPVTIRDAREEVSQTKSPDSSSCQ